MTEGYEWPGLGDTVCMNVAEDRDTKERFSCMLRAGHDDVTCVWRQHKGGLIRQVSWIAVGALTFVGGSQ